MNQTRNSCSVVLFCAESLRHQLERLASCVGHAKSVSDKEYVMEQFRTFRCYQYLREPTR